MKKLLAAALAALLALTLVLPLAGCTSKLDQYLDLGMKYLSEGNYEEAILAFTSAIEIDPKSVPAYEGRADAYAAQGDYAAAEKDYTAAINLAATGQRPAIAEKQTEMYLAQADLLIEQGLLDEAAALLEKALNGDPSLSEGNETYAAVYERLQSARLTAESPAPAFAADGALAEYILRGTNCFSEEKYEEAILVFTEATELDPTFAPAYRLRGDVYTVQGNYAGAAADYEKALSLQPDSPDTLISAAHLQALLGNWDAVQEYAGLFAATGAGEEPLEGVDSEFHLYDLLLYDTRGTLVHSLVVYYYPFGIWTTSNEPVYWFVYYTNAVGFDADGKIVKLAAYTNGALGYYYFTTYKASGALEMQEVRVADTGFVIREDHYDDSNRITDGFYYSEHGYTEYLYTYTENGYIYEEYIYESGRPDDSSSPDDKSVSVYEYDSNGKAHLVS